MSLYDLSVEELVVKVEVLEGRIDGFVQRELDSDKLVDDLLTEFAFDDLAAIFAVIGRHEFARIMIAELTSALDEALDLYEQAENDQCAIDYSDVRAARAKELRALTCETCALIAEGKTPGCLRHR